VEGVQEVVLILKLKAWGAIHWTEQAGGGGFHPK
jgi:hypothetical protein